MEFDLNIKKVGKLSNIFEFYKYFGNNYEESKNNILLESVSENSQEMMFSFIGVKPDFIVKVMGEKMDIMNITSEMGDKIKEMGESHEFKYESDYKMPFEDNVSIELKGIDRLKEIIPITKSAMPELFPRKIFSGGLLGYIGYDVVAPYVGYTPSDCSREQFPDIVMGLYSNTLVYSHSTKTLYHVTNSLGNLSQNLDVTDVLTNYKNENKTEKGLKLDIDPKEFLNKETNFKTNTSMDEWIEMVTKTKEHIVSGDVIQAVISRKMIETAGVKPIDVYQALRILNPSPYMYYLDFEGVHNGDIRIIGSSPEALITKNQSQLMTVPIAGTRRRGRNPQDEIKMEQELLGSTKELAEHIMLVDLARNDLSKVSVPGTVDTYELIKLKKFPSVMHLISKVKSTSYLEPFRILKSMFPAGTVSGAPKRRAMEIIQKLEKENRGPYAGTVGYISFTGDMDMAISIRTMFNKNKQFIAQAGAGIVADSSPEEEYLETANKMKGILSTINLARHIMEFGE